MDRRTVEAYEKQAEIYDASTADFWNLFPVGFIEKFAAGLTGKVLDIGSGPGRDGLLLRAAGLRVTCVDAAKAMVEMCRERGLEAVRADLLDLPFGAEEFDGVWSYTTFLHVKKSELPQALGEARRVLKPKGMMALGMIEGEGEVFKVKSGGITMPRLFSYYSEAELSAALSAAGFEIKFRDSIKPRSWRYFHIIAEKK